MRVHVQGESTVYWLKSLWLVLPSCCCCVPSTCSTRRHVVTRKSDVYGYGMIVWEVTTAVAVSSPYNTIPVDPSAHHTPWEGYSPDEIQASVVNNIRLPVHAGTLLFYKQLYEDCVLQNPRERPTAQQIVNRFKPTDLSMLEV